MTWILQQTTTTRYQVNVEEVDKLYCGTITSEHLDAILARGGGKMARDAEAWLVETFERHDGSIYGDELFYDLASQDTGYELVYEED